MADKGRRSQLGVKLPLPSGLHFESCGGIVAGSQAGPPGELSSPGTIAWGEKWQKKAHQPVILPPLGRMGGAGVVEGINYSWDSSQETLCTSLCWQISLQLQGREKKVIIKKVIRPSVLNKYFKRQPMAAHLLKKTVRHNKKCAMLCKAIWM